MTIEAGSGNVFADLGLEQPEELTYKANIIMEIQNAIKVRGITQTMAAEICGTDQPTLSKILRGNITLATTDRLFTWLVRLGYIVKIT
ncbi:helix-turn-helix domain-containing protein [Desulfovibrio gilichinskyi]|uniref:Predicted DNA-binding protein, contains XRE-type HTH domain n=1 Tax=Desulfovibrio gilichinskyi TaxID=1519643 RepID=A0A1X7C9Z6_9BACT|nr:helix-turn-helix transcriptional regulator [Desulfovibrio gilichinskyi]SME92557.1 Predicted DNA-binding protein, contains XRE-type HTH domain [Desulfovibrio gilichinskyi]